MLFLRPLNQILILIRIYILSKSGSGSTYLTWIRIMFRIFILDPDPPIVLDPDPHIYTGSRSTHLYCIRIYLSILDPDPHTYSWFRLEPYIYTGSGSIRIQLCILNPNPDPCLKLDPVDLNLKHYSNHFNIIHHWFLLLN